MHSPRFVVWVALLIFLAAGGIPFSSSLASTALATLSGVPVAANATYVDLDTVLVKDFETFTEELQKFPNLTKVDMYQSRVKKATMAMLSEQFPNIRFGWTLRFGTWRIRTDATAFSTLNNTHSKAYTASVFEVLKYCKDLQALDLGHNMVKDISFLQELPHLRILILSDNCVEDLTPLSALTELEYVELFRNHITDLSPLAGLPNLLDVNVCRNFNLKDASALYQCPNLKRVWLSYCGISEDAQASLRAAFPDCQFNFTVYSSTAGGWREHSRYKDIVSIFASRVYHPWSVNPAQEQE